MRYGAQRLSSAVLHSLKIACFQISRLYRPLNTDADSSPSDDEDDEDISGTQLLPLHHQQPVSPGTPAKSPRTARPGPPKTATRLSDVWDEREELFDIGEESDEEDTTPRPGRGGAAPPPPPKIVVTNSE